MVQDKYYTKVWVKYEMYPKAHTPEFSAGCAVWEGCENFRRWKMDKGKAMVCS